MLCGGDGQSGAERIVSMRSALAAKRRTVRRSWLAGLMALSVVLVAVLGLWDQDREAEAMLADVEHQQSTLATLIATTVTERLGAARVAAGPSAPAPEIGALLRGVDVGDDALVALRPPGDALFRTASGRGFESAPLRDILAGARSSTRLTRPQAAALRLPERIAVAGTATADAGPLGRWDVAVVASAASERDRVDRARWRLLCGVLLTGALVLGFGGSALRAERKELALIRELTMTELQQKRDEQLEREGRAATMLTLAGGVAHEIATPLSVIHGRAEQLLERLGDDPRSARALQRILEQSSRIDGVIRGFLRFARGDSPTLEGLDPAEVVRDVVGLVEHRFTKAGVRLTRTAAPGLGPVRADRRLLEHALVNLLLNACDACEPGGQVSLSVAQDAERAEVCFEVEDDGHGISPDLVARVTEPFFSTKPAGQGTGLGLAIAGEIVKIHRGALSLSPREPRGTRASVRLPTTRGAADAAA